MCASGAGMSTASSAREAVHVGHEERLVRERALRVQHALRRAARSRREQHRRERGGVGPVIDDGSAGAVDGVVVDACPRACAAERRSTPSAPRGARRVTSVAVSSGPSPWWIGAAIAPMRQHARYIRTTGLEFGACHATTAPGSTPRRATTRRGPRPRSAVSASSSCAAQQRVERRDVPRAARTRVLVGERVLVGGANRFAQRATSRPRPTGAGRRGGSCR